VGGSATTFDLASQAFKRDPFPTLAEMRAAGPVVRSRVPLLGPVAFATTHEAVTALLKDAERFAVDPHNAGNKRVAGLKWWMPKVLRRLTESMLTKDDPDHRRLRRLVDAAFHRTSVDPYRARIAETADRLIDDLAAAAGGDLVRHFARPLPLAVICDILGLPQADRPRFIKWMAAMSNVASLAGFIRMLPALQRLSRYLRDRFEERRRTPRDDLISALVEAEAAGDRLTEDELLAMCFLLFVAGHETTTHLISGGVLALLQHPDQLARLRADGSLAGTAVDELLRFVSPVQMSKPRYARGDLSLAGVDLARGESVIAMLAAANADPAAFPAPEALDLTRTPNRHLAFGGGPHLCLGLQLARAEAEIALERLLARAPELALAAPEARLRWTPRIGLRALRRLPVRGFA
jgi:cytochrome P450